MPTDQVANPAPPEPARSDASERRSGSPLKTFPKGQKLLAATSHQLEDAKLVLAAALVVAPTLAELADLA